MLVTVTYTLTSDFYLLGSCVKLTFYMASLPVLQLWMPSAETRPLSKYAAKPATSPNQSADFSQKTSLFEKKAEMKSFSNSALQKC